MLHENPTFFFQALPSIQYNQTNITSTKLMSCSHICRSWLVRKDQQHTCINSNISSTSKENRERKDMSAGAAEGLVRCVFDVSLSLSDVDIERRPYHRNCGCALHKPGGGGGCSKRLNPNKKISYPMKRSWSESCLVSAGSSFASSSWACSSPSLSGERNRQLELCKEEES